MNSMIDRIYELNHDESINSTITVMPKKEANTLSQFELDIFNSVFKSGEILNIPSVKNSQKYSNVLIFNFLKLCFIVKLTSNLCFWTYSYVRLVIV